MSIIIHFYAKIKPYLKKLLTRNAIFIQLTIIFFILGYFAGNAYADKPVKVQKKTLEIYGPPKPIEDISSEKKLILWRSTSTTTTTTVPKVVYKKSKKIVSTPQAPTNATNVPQGDDIYIRLANCESGDPTYNGPSGFDGAFQFLPSTWNSMNTGYAFAYEAPFEVQLDAAKRLIARSGWGQFPACAKELGML